MRSQQVGLLVGNADTHVLATGPMVVVAGGAASWAATHVQACLRGGSGGRGRLQQFRRLGVAMQSMQQHEVLKMSCSRNVQTAEQQCCAYLIAK